MPIFEARPGDGVDSVFLADIHTAVASLQQQGLHLAERVLVVHPHDFYKLRCECDRFGPTEALGFNGRGTLFGLSVMSSRSADQGKPMIIMHDLTQPLLDMKSAIPMVRHDGVS